MARARSARPSLEDQLAALAGLDTASPGAEAALRAALGGSSGILIAAAARRVGDDRLDGLAGALAPAFEKLLGDDAAKRDPGCRGKIAVAKALHALDRWDDAVFVRGLRVIQLEGWEQEDTAGALRGLCGIAHAQAGRDDALDVLAELLADKAAAARAGAARGLGDSGRRDGAALLRFKLLIDDPSPDVIEACVESLLHLSRDDGFQFLLRFLDAHDERAQVVALALGGTRRAAAFEPLAAWCVGCSTADRHRVGYLAIALVRSDASTAYLTDAIRDQARAGALAAARALATFKDDASLAAQVRAAAASRKDAGFTREVEELLAP